MNKKAFVGVLVVVILISFWFFNITQTKECSAKDGTCKIKEENQLTAERIKKEIKDNKALLVDVRELDEYQAGHAKESINYPLSKIDMDSEVNLDKNKKLYVYCRSGNRSSIAKAVLDDKKYQVIDLGGLADVEQLGFDFIK